MQFSFASVNGVSSRPIEIKNSAVVDKLRNVRYHHII